MIFVLLVLEVDVEVGQNRQETRMRSQDSQLLADLHLYRIPLESTPFLQKDKEMKG